MEQMVKELKENGAILEEEDFLNYTAIQRDPVESMFANLTVLGVPPPSSGAVIALILNILHGQYVQQGQIQYFERGGGGQRLQHVAFLQ